MWVLLYTFVVTLQGRKARNENHEVAFVKKFFRNFVKITVGREGCVAGRVKPNFYHNLVGRIIWFNSNFISHIAASLDNFKTLYDNYLCLVALNKHQIQWTRTSEKNIFSEITKTERPNKNKKRSSPNCD